MSDLRGVYDNHYRKVIKLAKDTKQETESIYNQRTLKTSGITDESNMLMMGMDSAVKQDVEYYRQLEDLIIQAGNAEDRRRIINEANLSITQREYLLKKQELSEEKLSLETEQERLLQDTERLTPLFMSGKLTREQRIEWEQIAKRLQEIGLLLDKNKKTIEETNTEKLRRELSPLVGLISGGVIIS